MASGISGPAQGTLADQARGLLSGCRNRIANAANLSALLFMEVPDINWVGFYFLHQDQLVLGPFQGKPACTTIALGAGVCGAAAVTRKTQRVADVHAFAGHIACDADSRSEIVIPLARLEQLIGVLDIDSPRHGRFSARDQTQLEEIAAIYLASID